ncbi:MAG TPA: hypothetical protein VHB73_00270, partial [Alphaproteobacteria bacterium]|nr:hypothetical protein [Alphaproteobacteria bacterium]
MAQFDRYQRFTSTYHSLPDLAAEQQADVGRHQVNRPSLQAAVGNAGRNNPTPRPGDKIEEVAFDDKGGAFGWMNGGSKNLKIVHDGTGIGKFHAIEAAMKQQGIKKSERHPVMKLPTAKAQGSFQGQDLSDYVIEGNLPNNFNNGIARNTAFNAGGGMSAAGTNFVNVSWGAGDLGRLNVAGATFTNNHMHGNVQANQMDARNAAFVGAVFSSVTDANLSGSIHYNTNFANVEAARVTGGLKGNYHAENAHVETAAGGKGQYQSFIAGAETAAVPVAVGV